MAEPEGIEMNNILPRTIRATPRVNQNRGVRYWLTIKKILFWVVALLFLSFQVCLYNEVAKGRDASEKVLLEFRKFDMESKTTNGTGTTLPPLTTTTRLPNPTEPPRHHDRSDQVTTPSTILITTEATNKAPAIFIPKVAPVSNHKVAPASMPMVAPASKPKVVQASKPKVVQASKPKVGSASKPKVGPAAKPKVAPAFKPKVAPAYVDKWGNAYYPKGGVPFPYKAAPVPPATPKAVQVPPKKAG